MKIKNQYKDRFDRLVSKPGYFGDIMLEMLTLNEGNITPVSFHDAADATGLSKFGHAALNKAGEYEILRKAGSTLAHGAGAVTDFTKDIASTTFNKSKQFLGRPDMFGSASVNDRRFDVGAPDPTRMEQTIDAVQMARANPTIPNYAKSLGMQAKNIWNSMGKGGKVATGLAAAGLTGYGIYKFATSDTSTIASDNGLLDNIASLDRDDEAYNDQLNICIEKIKNRSGDPSSLIAAARDSGLIDNPNVKQALIAAQIPGIETVYDDVTLGSVNAADETSVEEDKGFFDSMGEKGKELYNTLTSSPAAKGLTFAALAAAGLAGVYWLYKKWKKDKTITPEDVQAANSAQVEVASESIDPQMMWMPKKEYCELTESFFWN